MSMKSLGWHPKFSYLKAGCVLGRARLSSHLVFNEIALALPGVKADFFMPSPTGDEQLSLYDFNSGELNWQGSLCKKPLPQPSSDHLPWRVEWDIKSAHNHYTQLFESSTNHLLAGTCKKIVPSVGISGTWSGDWIAGLEHIRHSFLKPSPFYRHWLLTDDKLSVGHSPELLISKVLDKKFFETRALAGTSDLGAEPEKWSDKLKDEHRWVVDDIQKQLSSLGSVQTLPMRVLSAASKLFHLETPMHFLPAQTCTPTELIAELHPTAALGVLPRSSVPLDELYRGSFLREGFGAPLCWQKSADEFTVWIRIRSIDFLRSGECRCVVGGGLIAGSQFDEEWNEIQKKLRATLEALDLNYQELE